MRHVLVLAFEGFSFSSRQLYEQLLPKLISRAVVHESLTVQDALNYVLAGWPTHILVTDHTITNDRSESRQLLEAVANITKQGCTTVLMGFFAGSIEFEDLNDMFQRHFDLRWRAAGNARSEARLLSIDESLIRTASLVPQFDANAVFLSKVPAAQTLYAGSMGATMTAYAACGRVGLGKLGYIGDVEFREEPERIILAMCGLDTPEDSLEAS